MAPPSTNNNKSNLTPPPRQQKNLFSFFSKKPTPPPKAAAATTAANSAGNNKGANAKTNSNSNSGNKNASANTKPSPTTNNTNTNTNANTAPVRKGSIKSKSINISPLHLKLLSKITIGTKLAVFWPDDKEYYPCITTHHLPSAGSEYIYRLEYDDGEIETIDLATEKFRVIGGVKRDAGGGASGEKPGDAKKRRRILEESDSDDDDDDDDDDVDMEENDSGSEYKGGNDSDGDVSLQVEEDSAQESEDDDAVFDDESDDNEEEDAPPTKKKTIPKKTGKVTVTRVSNGSAAKPSRFVSPIPPNDARKPSTLSATNIDFSNFSPQSSSSASSSSLDASPLRVVAKSSPINNNNNNNNKNTIRSLPMPISQTQTRKEEGTVVAPPKPIPGTVNQSGSHFHNHLAFFTTSRIDAHRHPSTSPNFSPHTLHVDYTELERKSDNGKLSPAQRQWWEIKAQYADTVLLFKTGKFYEMFHDDADVAVSVLGFVYMKGTVAHAGFPEAAYGTMVNKLVDAGYKVARVEQTETPDDMKERKKTTTGKKPQVVCREVCGVVTRGTRTFCFLEDDRCLEKMMSGGGGNQTGPLVVIKETLLDEDGSGTEEDDDSGTKAVCEYGVTIVDAITGVVTLGQFADDVLRSRMVTLLASFSPSEILYEGGENGASKTLLSLLKSACLPSTIIGYINPKERFPKSTAVKAEVRKMLDRVSSDIHPWDANEAVKELHRRAYYPRSSRKNDPSKAGVGDGIGRWPEVLRACIQGKAMLALSSFGAALYYLQRSLVDAEILSMGMVKAYIPPNNSVASCTSAHDNANSTNAPDQLQDLFDKESRKDEGTDLVQEQPPVNSVHTTQQENATYAAESTIDHMALDGTTIANLEILHQISNGSYQGSLLSKIDATQSPHGSRLLRAWLLRPLFRKADIDRRADVVEELTGGSAAMAMSEARPLLKKTGDIERLLSRVHSMGGGGAGAGTGEGDGPSAGGYHPDERAVLYEMDKHTKRKVGDFSKLLNGLRSAADIPDLFENVDIQSPMLAKIVRTTDADGCFPSEMKEKLDWFFDNFDLQKAAQGKFEPCRGMDEEYDAACDAIRDIRQELDDYKNEMCSVLKCRSAWKYINEKEESKDKYLIELPVSIRVPDDFYVKAKRGKGANQVNKYRTPVVEQLIQDLERAIDAKNAGKAAGMKLVFAKFDSMRSVWMAATHATAMLDALGSLAEIAVQPGFCRPRIVDCPPSAKPGIKVLQGRHPCVDVTHSGGDFIPNNLILGGNVESSEEAFDQMDSSDESSVLLLSGPNMGGKSTLLRQTCLITILAQMGSFVPAEKCALTPVDRIFTRLGASDRILLGQSTFFVELAETAAAVRGATRRSLVIMDELGRGTSTFDGTAIASATVKHLIERNKCLTLFATHYHSLLEDWKNEPTIRLGHMECIVEDDNITFLYTLGEGPCPKSFGVNVARLAGLPDDVLQKAKAISAAFEAEMSGESNHHKIIPSTAVKKVEEIAKLVSDGVIGDKLQSLWESLQ